MNCNSYINVKISMHLLSIRGKYFQYRIQCIEKRRETAMTRSAFDVLMNAQRELCNQILLTHKYSWKWLSTVCKLLPVSINNQEESSSAISHATEILGLYDLKPILLIYSDGDPDHNLTFLTTQILYCFRVGRFVTTFINKHAHTGGCSNTEAILWHVHVSCA